MDFSRNTAFFTLGTLRFAYFVSGIQVTRWRFAQLLVECRALRIDRTFDVRPASSRDKGFNGCEIHRFKCRNWRRRNRQSIRRGEAW